MTTETIIDIINDISAAARKFLEGLEPAELKVATFPFTKEEERTRFFYTPTDHGGLSFSAMTPRQQSAAMHLLSATMSSGFYATAATIMGLENVLAGNEGFTDFDHDPDTLRTRDPNRYQISIFGVPGEEPWGWRFGGHHVSVHLLVAGGEIRLLPSFLGANPANSAGVGANQLRPLGAEEDLGRALAQSFNTKQLAVALLSDVAPPDMVTTNRSELSMSIRTEAKPWTIWRRAPDEFSSNAVKAVEVNLQNLGESHLAALEYTIEPKGIFANTLESKQREALDALLKQYVARMPNGLANAEQSRINAIDDATMTFAWAGSLEPGEGHYYRIQAPDLLVEYDNTQNGANHIHTVWRDPQMDFGRDLLAEHYKEAHTTKR